MREALTWLGIALVTSAFLAQRHKAALRAEVNKRVDLNANDEVDPTRWRHTGVQPFDRINQNADHAGGAVEMDLAKELGFRGV